MSIVNGVKTDGHGKAVTGVRLACIVSSFLVIMDYYVNLRELLKEWKYTPQVVVNRLNKMKSVTVYVNRYDSDYDLGKLFYLAGKSGVSMPIFKIVRFTER